MSGTVPLVYVTTDSNQPTVVIEPRYLARHSEQSNDHVLVINRINRTRERKILKFETYMSRINMVGPWFLCILDENIKQTPIQAYEMAHYHLSEIQWVELIV
ncbi:hypothetical protein BLOT_006089 [Blomia tropicalis]|nr:hypothetical protein BLOT_006089 [Blomia tropicalis]